MKKNLIETFDSKISIDLNDIFNQLWLNTHTHNKETIILIMASFVFNQSIKTSLNRKTYITWMIAVPLIIN